MEANHIWAPYCGSAPLPAELAARWNFDPLLLAVLAGISAAYFLVLPATSRRPLAFAAALAVAAILFVSPFCALTSALFSARVVHHLLLTIALAPLILLALPRFTVRGPGGLWVGLHIIVFWFWHAPQAYSAALSSHFVYWAMQVSILGSALLFWAWLRQSGIASAIAALLATTVAMGLLGALLTFAGQPLYAPHFRSTSAWGLTPLDDQQLGGLIMWAPGGGFYLAAALLLAARWLRRQEPAGALS